MSTGQALTVVFLVTQGATAYYNNALTIDGNSVTPKYQGGTAYTSGNAVLTQANNTIKSLWNSKAKNIPSSAPVNEEPSSKTYSKWWPPLKDKTKNGVRAGDLIVYKSGHGAVVVRVNKDSAGNPISVNTVEGNYSTFVTYVKNVPFTNVKGFAAVVE
jgi:hypothetical protein